VWVQGKLVGIAGPFSSGKTSLIRALLGQVGYMYANATPLRGVLLPSADLGCFRGGDFWEPERSVIGKHTFQVQQRLRIGIILFIIREICFFSAFF